MKYLVTGLFFATLSATAIAGTAAPVSVPEPGTLGLFAASIAVLFAIRKFRK